MDCSGQSYIHLHLSGFINEPQDTFTFIQEHKFSGGNMRFEKHKIKVHIYTGANTYVYVSEDKEEFE